MKKIIFLVLLISTSFQSVYGQYTKLHDFDSIKGRNPNGDLLLIGSYLYGMTEGGGAKDSGTVFKIKPDGTGYSKLHDFADSLDGSAPFGSFFSDGTYLYGMTHGDINNDFGTIFKIMPDGTGFTNLYDFNINANGYNPFGSLISDGTFLYGLASQGDNNDGGVLFKIKPDGTGDTILHDFSVSANGRSPWGSLISDGIFLYGMTIGGGTGTCPSGCGTVFKIKPDGTGYVKLLDFTGTANGSHPAGSLISDGTFLYGMTSAGGTSGDGTIFKMKPDGTGYVKMYDFAGVANGSAPEGSLVSVGNFMYGMTLHGGTGNTCQEGCGVLFKIKPDGTGYSKLFDFTLTNGIEPGGSLISDGTFLYGMTAFGGNTNDNGTIFKYQIAPAGITENNEEIGFHIYPNPSNGIFSIATKENNYMLVITNLLGENIYQTEIKNSKTDIIDLSKQAKGIYFVKIFDGQKILTEKIVVQ